MNDRMARLEEIVEAVRREFAPDPRTAVWEIELEPDDGSLTLSGATSEAGAAEALHRELAVLDGWRAVHDRVLRLPVAPSSEPAHAVVASSVVPLLAGPTVAEPQVSQAVLGRRMTVLRRHGRWLQCRSDDGYLGWVHRGYVRLCNETEARAWEIGAGGEAAVSLGAVVRDPAGEVVARLPWGARALLRQDGAAELPDGTVGQPEGALIPLQQITARFVADGEQMTETAARWLGAPYLWGGVTRAGVDCSGLVQAVFRLHGIALPRDSDLQALQGEPVAPDPHFSNLRPGDLLFFAEGQDRITHVTLSLGGSRIIHSSLGNGGVRRNDLLGDLAYERELRSLFVCARRYL